ncbi:MAG: hypothetical protein C0402_08195, partial [Thermodesulfovibrio sp.]|nr:hypothetical protein [Thermodesulfovibrio sp.]
MGIGMLSNKEYLSEFNRKSAELRVPISGSIDLTRRCNLKCLHCYLGTSRRDDTLPEMTAGQICSVIDELADAGCLYLLMTGGEPLLRPDFQDIYRHAKMKGLILTLFTNGTLISDKDLELLMDLPPYVVEISLYGATAATYEKITGVEGSYKKCLAAITRLLENKVPVRLKTILMTCNSHEFFDMETLAKDFGVKFRFDAAIFPAIDGDRSPLGLRVSAADAVEKEFSDRERAMHWREYFNKTQNLPFSGSLYSCGAGLTGFHINASGRLLPCLMTTGISYNLLEGSFLQGWRDVISGIKEKIAAEASACTRCERKSLCGFCPSFFNMENGAEDIRSEYLCAMGNQRFLF